MVLPVFKSMQAHGLYVHREHWLKAIAECKTQMLEYQGLARKLLSGPEHLDLFGESSLNLNSPVEVSKALAKLQEPQEAQMALDCYREAAKLVQTYGDNFVAHIDPNTWRIHAQFDSNGTSTGRVSCHSPNLQNLPSDSRFQACLTAPQGRVTIQADYSACELRILADFSGEPVFLQAFETDQDLHAQVALTLFGDIKFRDKAKAINFGIVYGMGTKSLANSIGVSLEKAEQLLNQYFQKHARIKAYLDWSVQQAYHNGYAKTRLGRRLYLDPKQDISRIAKNMPIQGTAAEIAKLAMVRIHERLSQDFQDAYLVNMIHDELVAECNLEDRDTVASILKLEMERAQSEITPRVKPKAEIG